MSFQDFGPGIGVLSSKYVVAYIHDFQSFEHLDEYIQKLLSYKTFHFNSHHSNCYKAHPSFFTGKNPIET